MRCRIVALIGLSCLAPCLAHAEPDEATETTVSPAVDAAPRTIDPASESDIPVTGQPGRGDKAVSDMKSAGVTLSDVIREMVANGYSPVDIAAGLRIYDVHTPDAAVVALTKARCTCRH